MLSRLPLALGFAAALTVTTACADEATIRKTISERLPGMTVDEVSKTPIPGLFEVRIGTDILYSDARGDYLIQGSLFDTKNRIDLTQARIDKLTAIDFATLPLKDAMVAKQGNGARKLVVFADPNCGYCKRFERDLLDLKNVTIYTFLYPILGPDSLAKSRAIWCAKDAQATWRAWMIDGQTPPAAPAKCDAAALDRNLELGRKHRVTGTPAVVFADGSRVPGAVPLAELEKRLAQVKP